MPARTNTPVPKDVEQSENMPRMDPLLLDALAAAAFIDVSRATFWKLHASGKIPLPLRLSQRVVRWRKEELVAWVRAGCPSRDKWKHIT